MPNVLPTDHMDRRKHTPNVLLTIQMGTTETTPSLRLAVTMRRHREEPEGPEEGLDDPLHIRDNGGMEDDMDVSPIQSNRAVSNLDEIARRK